MRPPTACVSCAHEAGDEDDEEEAATSGKASSDGLAVRDPAAVDRAAVAAWVDRGADRPTLGPHPAGDPLCDQHPGVSDALCPTPTGTAQGPGSQDVPALAGGGEAPREDAQAFRLASP